MNDRYVSPTDFSAVGTVATELRRKVQTQIQAAETVEETLGVNPGTLVKFVEPVSLRTSAAT